jgi:hypothetical protein
VARSFRCHRHNLPTSLKAFVFHPSSHKLVTSKSQSQRQASKQANKQDNNAAPIETRQYKLSYLDKTTYRITTTSRDRMESTHFVHKYTQQLSSASLPSVAATDDASISSHSEYAGSDDTKSVSFGFVEVREYNRIVGDHPEVRFGPPLGLGWEFHEHDRETIDKYESVHPRRKLQKMSSITRRNLLQNVFGATDEEIQASEKECQRIQKRREQSKNQAERTGKVESKKKVLRRFFYGLLIKGSSMPTIGMSPMGMSY